jgi:RND family efflux transporter MFP subunit
VIVDRLGTRRFLLATSQIVAVLCLLFNESAQGRDPKAGMACYVKPQHVVAIGAPVIGVLQRISVDRGDPVKAGDIVAVLESSLERAEVRVAKAKAQMEAALLKADQQVAFSRRKVERAKNLTKTSAIAAHELDEAETEERVAEVSYREAQENKALAEAELERAETALALRTIASPIGGLVLERLVSPGELVRQTAVLRIAQLDPLRVEVHAPSAIFGKVRPGMKAEVRLDVPSIPPQSARVVGMAPTIEPAAVSFGIWLELPNPELRLPAGVTCTATLFEN